MALLQKLDKQIPWFRVAIVALFLATIALRFWGLGRFNTFVFDEVYYVKFANNYLTQTPFFDGHPPLSKYLIALGIWIGEHTFGADSPKNNLAGSPLSPISYRWLTAFTGSLIPLVVAGLAYQLSHRHRFALIAGLFAALDGLFLVESRYALNNVYLVIFGLLGQWCLLLGLERIGERGRGWRDRPALWFVLSGLCFGASASIKWNGLWFLLGACFLWICAWGIKLLGLGREADIPVTRSLDKLRRMNPIAIGFYFGAIPFLLYSIIWIPHIQLNPEFDFWEVQRQILLYHERVGGNTTSVHPYCSSWYSWLGMIRPVLYFYETARDRLDIVPVKPAIPASEVKLIYDVHAMGNPFLWWLSTAAIFLLLVMVWRVVQARLVAKQPSVELAGLPSLSVMELGVPVYLLANYAANLLPWVRVTRCTFLYHYMGASVFASLGLAWFVDRWLTSPDRTTRIVAVTILFLIALAFLFWLPVYLGLPLSPIELTARRWLRTW